jgi:hypothetical protein
MANHRASRLPEGSEWKGGDPDGTRQVDLRGQVLMEACFQEWTVGCAFVVRRMPDMSETGNCWRWTKKR